MSEPKPRIQLSCEQGAFAAYADAVAAAGGLPCPGYAPEPDLSCVGLVLCGGGDLDPDMFGWPQAGGDPPDRERDVAELALFRAFYQAGRPILGICRGIQFINAAPRGTLWQDLPSQHPSDIEHHMNPPYDAFGHNVSLVPGTPLASLFAGQTEIAVNSYHHQAVREPAAGLEVMAVAPDGVIEALYRPASHFLWAVQWHPEFLYKVDPRSQAIFDAFVGSCR